MNCCLSAPLLALMLLSAATSGCRARQEPSQVLASAVAEAQAGRIDSFLAHFEPESEARLGLFWTVASRYGYLPERGGRFLSELTVLQEQVDGDRAELLVSDGAKEGRLRMVRVDGRWLIDLREDSRQ